MGYGSTNTAGNLTLISTANATKGFIYLGLAQPRIAFDEVQGFVGIGTDTPIARLHIKPAAGGNFEYFEHPSFTVASCTAASGDWGMTTAASFAPVGGPRVEAGMGITGTNIPAGTTVVMLLSSSRLLMSAQTTGAISAATITFTPSSAQKSTNDESGFDMDMILKPAVRFTAGNGGAPLRIVGNVLPTTVLLTGAAGARTITNCSAAGSTNTITTTGSFASLAVGDFVEGGTIAPYSSRVEQIVNTTTIKISTQPTAFSAQTLTFRTSANWMALEVGLISGGTATGTNLRLGGVSHGEASVIHIQTKAVWFSRGGNNATPPPITNNVSLGININPQDFSGGVFNRSLVIGAASGTPTAHLCVLTDATWPIELVTSTFTGTTPNRTFSNRIWGVTADGHVNWLTGSAGAEVVSNYISTLSQNSGGGARIGFRAVDNQADPSGGTFANNNIFTFTRSLEWATVDVSPVMTTRLDMGDNNRGIICGQAGAKLVRMGIATTFLTIASGTSRTITVGTALLHLELLGTTATVGQVIKLSGVQTADIWQAQDSTGAPIGAITARGAWAGHTDIVFTDDEIVSYEDDSVFYY